MDRAASVPRSQKANYTSLAILGWLLSHVVKTILTLHLAGIID